MAGDYDDLDDCSGSRDALVSCPRKCNTKSDHLESGEHHPNLLVNFLISTICGFERHQEPELEKTLENHHATVSNFCGLESCIDATAGEDNGNDMDATGNKDEVEPLDLPNVVSECIALVSIVVVVLNKVEHTFDLINEQECSC